MLTYDIDLNVTPGSLPRVIHVKQYQTDALLRFRLYSEHGTLSIGNVSGCTIRGTKNDGNGYSANGTYNSSTKQVSVYLTEQMTAIFGVQPFEIVITDSSGKMITSTFYLKVQRAAMDQDTVSNSVIVELLDALNHTNDVLAARNEVTSNRDKIRNLLNTGFVIFTDPNDDGNIVIRNATV